jgi:hypothetical protein
MNKQTSRVKSYATRANFHSTVSIQVVVVVLSLCGLLVVSQIYLAIPLIPLISQILVCLKQQHHGLAVRLDSHMLLVS